MVRWRFCLVLAVLLLLPSISKLQDEEDDQSSDVPNGDSEDDEDEDDEDLDKPDEGIGRRAPRILPQVTRASQITRTTIKRRPLECYVCAYKKDTPLKACLDPTKYRVQTITCHSVDDKCATTVISKGSSFDAVVRSCKSACVSNPETTCCDLNLCNNEAFALPTVVAPKALMQVANRTSKSIPNSVLFFVTILLVLQTVVKVTLV